MQNLKIRKPRRKKERIKQGGETSITNISIILTFDFMKNNLFLITKLLKSHLKETQKGGKMKLLKLLKSHLKETQKGGKMKLLCLLLSGVYFVDRNYYYSSFFLLFDFFLFFFFIFFFFPFTICCGSCLFGLKQNLSFSSLSPLHRNE